MSSMGSIATSSYKDRFYSFNWQTASQSIANNTTTINWQVESKGAEGWRGEKEFIVQIDGKTVFTKATRVERYGEEEVASGSVTITHNTDGTRAFAVYVGAAVYTYGAYNVTASTTFTLDTIPKQATITAAPAFDDTQNPTITYSNPAGNNVTTLQACISVTGATDNVKYRDISKTGTSYTFTLTDAERLALQSAFPDTTGGWVYFYVKTVIAGTTYYSRMAKWFTIVDAPPTYNSCTTKDTNPVTLAFSQDERYLVKGLSTLEYTVSATANKGATIKEIKAYCGWGYIFGTSGVFDKVSSNKISFTITDSRGLVTTKDVTLIFINYFKPTIDFPEPKITTEGNCTLTITSKGYHGYIGSGYCPFSTQYRMKEGNGEWTDWAGVPGTGYINQTSKYQTLSGSKELTGLDYTKVYSFQARVTSAFDTVYSQEYTVKSFPVFDWGEDNFNFNVPIYMNGKQMDYILETTTSAIGSNGTWYAEKWASGKAVCYGTWNVGNTAVTSASGGVYVSTQGFAVSFPLNFFTSPPDIVQITPYSNTGGYPFTVMVTGLPNAGMLPGFKLMSPTSVTIPSAKVSIYAVGRWK